MIGNSMVAAYNSIHFWAKAANEADAVNPSTVLGSLERQSRDAPDGIVTIDAATNIVWRPFHIARIQPDGQFVVLFSIAKPVRPVCYVASRSALDWAAFLADLKAQWHGRWAASASSSGPSPAPVDAPSQPNR